MDKVFGDYDQAGLDAEYDNRAKVPDSMEFLRRSADLSRKWRPGQTGELNIPFVPGADEVLDIFPAKPARPRSRYLSTADIGE
jgi:arylformamidase